MARIRKAILLAALATALSSCAAHAGKRPTYANPLDIDYRYNFEQENEKISYRTGADPVVVRHDGAYYLFHTLADGYWRSTYLVDWRFTKPSRWPFESIVAPAAWSDGERLYLMPSMTSQKFILALDDPEGGAVEFFDRLTPPLPGARPIPDPDHPDMSQIPPGPWDPALFEDDDGRWYLYWNSSNFYPIYGVEIDMGDGLTYIGKPIPLISLDPESHGWERFGEDHSGALPNGEKISPFIEGAWMTKTKGKYYLQYAAPGTEYNAYANATYVSDSPLGPFEYAPYNPIAYRPGGFAEGAGHGSTFQDEYGNWWNTGTPWIGHNWTFERRISMFPGKFEDDGQVWFSTRFGDFPHYVPTERVENPESLFTGWMLLSYRKRAEASSTMGEFSANRASDENPRTFWAAGKNEKGETLTLDLGAPKTLRAIQVNFADHESDRYADAPDIYTEFHIDASIDGAKWKTIAGASAPRRDRPNAYLELKNPVDARFVRYVHGHVGGAHLAISDLRVFGNAPGSAPMTPRDVEAVRGADAREAMIIWRPVEGAVGYNVLWGIRPDRLTLAYQVFSDDAERYGRASQALRALNIGVNYYVAVEAFNESGVSARSESKPLH
ncbi:MAG: family 43 glycosylhydrolase [Pseudomonadota bacterium]